LVHITSVQGNTGANGNFTVTVLTPTTFQLNGTLGDPNTPYTGGGNWSADIVLTSSNHGLVTGQTVNVTGALGNTAANGTWTVTVIDADHFTLNGSASNGIYVGGGTWTVVGGRLVKLGTQRLIAQGAGSYTGGVDIQNGVILVQNDTALGLGSS